MFGLFKLVSAIVELVGREDGVWPCGARDCAGISPKPKAEPSSGRGAHGAVSQQEEPAAVPAEVRELLLRRTIPLRPLSP